MDKRINHGTQKTTQQKQRLSDTNQTENTEMNSGFP